MIELLEPYKNKFKISMHEIRHADFIGIINNGKIVPVKCRYDFNQSTFSNYNSFINDWDSEASRYLIKYNYEIKDYIIRVYGQGDFDWIDRFEIKLEEDNVFALIHDYGRYDFRKPRYTAIFSTQSSNFQLNFDTEDQFREEFSNDKWEDVQWATLLDGRNGQYILTILK